MAGKQHRARKAGSKAKKKKEKRKKKLLEQQPAAAAAGPHSTDGGRTDGGKSSTKKDKKVLTKEQLRVNNPKAFGVKSSLRARQSRSRKADREQKRLHAPVLDKTPDEPPPMVVLVHGPPGVGKSTVIKSLVKHYARQNISDTKGPISVVSGKNRRITLIECPKNLTGMIDASKIADLVLLVIDGNFGFEMETFEFLNLLQVHGFPKVMGVLTHLDMYKNKERLKKVKKGLKARFWNEIYEGAKLFYFSGLINGKYPKREVLNLARFISVQKVRPLTWRNQHPYVVADRMEDITPPDIIHQDPKCDRDLCMYGYVRGSNLRIQSRVHIAGAGDYDIFDVSQLPDPCPLPEKGHRKSLSDKSRLIYAPMANLGNLMYDKDATYIDIPDWKVQFSGAKVTGNNDGTGEQMVLDLQQTNQPVDEKLSQSTIQLFAGGRKVLAGDIEEEEGDSDDDDEDSSSESGRSESDSEDSGGSSGSEGGEDVGANGHGLEGGGDGRRRRRAIFADDGNGVNQPSKNVFDDSEDDSDSEDESEDKSINELLLPKESGAQWKERMGKNIATIFSTRASDIVNLVYGNASKHWEIDSDAKAGAGDRGSEDEDDLDFFKPVGAQGRASITYESDDCSKSKISLEGDTWTDADEFEAIRNRFVTGDWEAGNERSGLRPANESDSDSELYGDFEDLETGEKYGEDGNQSKDDSDELAIKKAAKKATFDENYDATGSKGKGGSSDQAPLEENAEDPTSYFDMIKQDMNEKYARARAELDAMDPQMRVSMEGYRPGTYVRLRFSGMPYELIKNFDPTAPLVIGGLLNKEHSVGLMRFRLKRHRWHKKILKNKDPLIFSIGWRRFQSIPVYNMQDVGGRYRMIKYTPEHMHCLATIFGPMAPLNTGLVAFQTLDSNQASWRISATGTILDFDHSSKIMKKLKIVGVPLQIHRNTAFIEGMFNSNLEVAKFEGASIKTVSGIRGTIKKAVKVPGKKGVARCTFEDKILYKDIVFTRSWIAVDVPRLYNPVSNLLQVLGSGNEVHQTNAGAESSDAAKRAFVPSSTFDGFKEGFVFTTGEQGLGYYADKTIQGSADVKSTMPLMKTVAQLRRERNLGAPVNRDSLYTQIDRPKQRLFNPLQIPKKLEAALPYRSKPKQEKKKKTLQLAQKRAVVLEPMEKKARTLLQMLGTIKNNKLAIQKASKLKKNEEREKKRKIEEAWRAELKKAEKKKRYIANR